MTAIAKIHQTPTVLWMLAVAFNAILFPYSGIHHDAHMYIAQVANRLEPYLAADLFFRFGSQDQYSLFSPLMRPIVAGTDLHLAFAIVYAATKALMIGGMLRFFRRLFDNPATATLAFVFAVMDPLSYCGQSIFGVNESFLTARVMTHALLFHAWERQLAGAEWTSLLLILLGMGLHPLTAVAALVVWTAEFLYSRTSGRVTAAVIGASVSAGMIGMLSETLPMSLFGPPLDWEWREMSRIPNPYLVPAWWWINDWLRVIVYTGVSAYAVYRLRDRAGIRLALFINLFAVLGFLGCIVASYAPYALLHKAQLYRFLWMQVALLPALVMETARADLASSSPTIRWRGLLLLALGLLPWDNLHFSVSCVLLAGLAAYALRAFRGPTRVPYLDLRAAGYGLAVGCLLEFLRHCLRHLDVLTGSSGYSIFYAVTEGLPTLGKVLLVLLVLARLPRWSLQIGPALLALAFGLCFPIVFSIGSEAAERDPKTGIGRDLAFLRSEIDKRREPGQTPTIFLPMPAKYAWIHLRAATYCDHRQFGSTIYFRDNGVELYRRVELVKPFLIDRPFRSLLGLTDPPALREQDKPPLDLFLRLAADPVLDFVVLPYDYPGWSAATNDHLALFDCRAVRRRLQAESDGNRNANR